MKVVDFSIIFDQGDGAYLPGQMLTGRVRLFLDAPKILKKIKIKFEGRAHVEWSASENDGDSRKSVTHSASEYHFKRELVLDERDEGQFSLQAGEHLYPFSALIPKNIPSSFKGSEGDISYYAVAKLIIPGQLNKIKKEYFKVKNYLNLNDFPDLKAPAEVQKSKKFYYLCCIPAGKLTLRACIPRSGFTGDESIPVILEINNESSVPLNKITAYIVRKVEFRTISDNNSSTKKLKSFLLGSVNGNSSLTLVESVPIPAGEFPYLENCHIVLLKHFLHIEADAAGAHCDLDVIIPITLGDIPFKPEDEKNHYDHFLLPPDYDEAGASNSGFVSYERSEDTEVVLSASSLATESKSAEIFGKCCKE